jgi:multidrug transporter EmrE-like cation transporter
MVGAYVILNSLGALAIKQTVQKVAVVQPGTLQGTVGLVLATLVSPVALLGLVAIGLSAGAWIVALSRMELSVAYPVAVGLNCLIVVSAGFGVFGEALTWTKLLGIGLLLCGLVLLFRG